MSKEKFTQAFDKLNFLLNDLGKILPATTAQIQNVGNDIAGIYNELDNFIVNKQNEIGEFAFDEKKIKEAILLKQQELIKLEQNYADEITKQKVEFERIMSAEIDRVDKKERQLDKDRQIFEENKEKARQAEIKLNAELDEAIQRAENVKRKEAALARREKELSDKEIYLTEQENSIKIQQSAIETDQTMIIEQKNYLIEEALKQQNSLSNIDFQKQTLNKQRLELEKQKEILAKKEQEAKGREEKVSVWEKQIFNKEKEQTVKEKNLTDKELNLKNYQEELEKAAGKIKK